MGQPFTMLAKQKRLPVQHHIEVTTEERSLPTGASFFLPTATVDFENQIDLTDTDQTTFSDFIEWINNYNDYIVNAWNDKRTQSEEKEIVDDFIDIEVEDEA